MWRERASEGTCGPLTLPIPDHPRPRRPQTPEAYQPVPASTTALAVSRKEDLTVVCVCRTSALGVHPGLPQFKKPGSWEGAAQFWPGQRNCTSSLGEQGHLDPCVSVYTHSEVALDQTSTAAFVTTQLTNVISKCSGRVTLRMLNMCCLLEQPCY